MGHISFQELQKLLDEAAKLVAVGSEYRHYKTADSRYKVTGLSILEASDTVAVRYASLLSPNVEFIRPIEDWLAKVEFEDKTAARFTKI